jgi:hypothetical protein
MDKHKYQIEKLANRKTGYPIATIAYYGPDNKMASKVVVGIFRSGNDKEPLEMRKWFARDQDVRRDTAIIHEMIDFIQTHSVHRVSMIDKIIGCPHEEGIDYPLGEACPQCPYWKGRDRWSDQEID